mmetsp:Transcript_50236/g.132237  ORF Transcript_50236/g.132237 Transcript_50236/m.132237 type:complete len:217 (+) Transcript_50236:301-951(+)
MCFTTARSVRGPSISQTFFETRAGASYHFGGATRTTCEKPTSTGNSPPSWRRAPSSALLSTCKGIVSCQRFSPSLVFPSPDLRGVRTPWSLAIVHKPCTTSSPLPLRHRGFRAREAQTRRRRKRCCSSASRTKTLRCLSACGHPWRGRQARRCAALSTTSKTPGAGKSSRSSSSGPTWRRASSHRSLSLSGYFGLKRHKMRFGPPCAPALTWWALC